MDALLPVSLEWRNFRPKSGIGESHVVVKITDRSLPAAKQFELLELTVKRLQKDEDWKGMCLVWRRYFVSDAINQASFIPTDRTEAISVVQQPPLDGTKAALWLYFAEGVSLSKEEDGAISMSRPPLTHLWHTQLNERIGDAHRQTFSVFEHYTRSLALRGGNLERNCIRTWLYVQDVDVQYVGMVDSRKVFFEEAGLLPETHYISSTGIEGRYLHPEVLVLMDAYAIPGIRKEQIRFLKGLTHLNPTYEYGVTFERGTAVEYGDRRHIFISGTASINNKGEIVHPLEIEKQTERTFENIQVLLAEAGATIDDVAQMIVYLRDTADYETVEKYVNGTYPDTPKVFVWAPVCRPGWLIEVECIAIRSVNQPEFAAY